MEPPIVDGKKVGKADGDHRADDEDHRHRYGQTLLTEEQSVATSLAEIVELLQCDVVARALRGSGFIRLIQYLPELTHRDSIGSRAKVTLRHRRPLDVDDLSRIG